MVILLSHPQGIAFCLIALLSLAYCGYTVRRLQLTFTTWRDGVLLSQSAVLLGIAAISLALLGIRGAGLLSVLSYNRNTPAIRDVFANLHSVQIDLARAEALLKQASEFELVSRPNFPPAPPDVTEATWSGTSLDKAIWLVARLDNKTARLVVGRNCADDRGLVAWVELTDERGVEWIFDPALRKPVPRTPSSLGQRLPHRIWAAIEHPANS